MQISLELFREVIVKDSTICDSIKEHCLRWFPISPCSSYLLQISLNRAGEATMHYKSDIGFIDAKSKCNGSHHDLSSAFHPVSLHSLAFSVQHSSMVVIAAQCIVTSQQ